MARIFINYRRSLSYHAAARLRDFLAEHFGPISIFLDDHAFEKGAIFPDRIRSGLASCEVFLPLIDIGWDSISDGETRRLFDPSDWVRIEIQTIIERNARRRAGANEPVLIVPILLNGVRMPRPENLPPEIREVTSRFGLNFTTESDIHTLIPIIESFLGDPLIGNLGIRLISASPDPSKSKLFRFRRPLDRQQLAPFVSISDDEPDISLANPGLRHDARYDLYDNWCQWTAENQSNPWHSLGNGTRSFLMLDRQNDQGGWEPVGVSILLPLSVEGGVFLAGASTEAARDPASRRNAVIFDIDHLEANSRCILIDTWAVSSAIEPGSGRRKRVNHYNWGVALLLRHLAEFWDPSDEQPITIMAEPSERVGRMLSNLGFERRQRNAASGDLYFLDYPLNRYRYGTQITAAIDKIVRNGQRLREFPIVSDPGHAKA